MGIEKRWVAGVAAALLLVACSDDGGGVAATVTSALDQSTSSTAGDDPTTVPTEPSTETSADQSTSAPSSGSTIDHGANGGAEDDIAVNEEPALGSVADFIGSWSAVAGTHSEFGDLGPTISDADVELDPTVGVDAFVEQATPSTVIGGIADPDTGEVTGLMGLSDPDSADTPVMIEIIWIGAFGSDERASLDELFPAESVRALEMGDQLTRIHDDKSIVLSHLVGATPDEGLFVFTVGDRNLLEEDPAHDTITNVVLGLLVRTS